MKQTDNKLDDYIARNNINANLTPEEWSATFKNMKRNHYNQRIITHELQQIIDEISFDGCSLCYSIQHIEDLITHFGNLLCADYLPEDQCFLVYLKTTQ